MTTDNGNGKAAGSYSTRSIRRKRRTKAEMQTLREAIYETLAAYHPMTLRQLFYQLVVKDVVPKTQAQYSGTVCRLLVLMREDGTIPFEWIVDNTRWMRKPSSYASLGDMLDEAQQFYRRDLWAAQDAYVEVWRESDAIAGVLYEVTSQWDVPLMVAKGFSSLTFSQSAGAAIEDRGKPAFVYYFGDRDPSGVHIDRNILKRLKKYAPSIDIQFRRVAVTVEQVEAWNLPSKPPKKSDSRSKNFKGEAVELDSIPPDQLMVMVERCVTRHIDHEALERLQTVEAAERNTLRSMISGMKGGAA